LRDTIGTNKMHGLCRQIEGQHVIDGDVVARALGKQRRADAWQFEIDMADFAKMLDVADARALRSLAQQYMLGRIPRVTGSPTASPCGDSCAAQSMPCASANTRPSPSDFTVASTKFIAGEPMKAATKRLAG
jgi:hypothetical protein